MSFIVKDLMISVLPKIVDAGELAGSCGACSSDSAGPPCSGICPGSRNPFEGLLEHIAIEGNPSALAILKQQMKEHINAIDKREKVVMSSMHPKSAADRKMLQEKLTDALKELQSQSAK